MSQIRTPADDDRRLTDVSKRPVTGWRVVVAGVLMAFALCCCDACSAAEPGIGREKLATRGWELLRTKPYLPPDFDDSVLKNLWKVWEPEARDLAAKATPEERRQMTFSRYGLMPVANEPDAKTALGYVPVENGGWTMNCLACHGGKVAGRVIPGLGNSHTALQSLTEDVRLTKISQFKSLSHLDLATLKLPLGTTHGTTNSVIFGVVLGNLRDRDMNVDRSRPSPPLTHHDMDAPPLWNVRYKQHLYADGFAPKNSRVLMQFMLLPDNGPDKLREWEPDFDAILAWIESLEPPRWPFDIDQALADSGRTVFNKHCAGCHGTYGPDGKYPERVVPLEKIGTDPVRLRALTTEHRKWMRDGWMSNYGRDPVEVDPVGYVAPPLHGIWASAPYFHNGSVPTLWHVLHSGERPAVWKRTEDGYDQKSVGLEVETLDAVPETARTPWQKRGYFDTTKPANSNIGHTFPDNLTEKQKSAVLEYLKTL